MKILIYAVSARDAEDMCRELGVSFDEVMWVMNYELLGGMDTEGWLVHATPMFRQMPAYELAKAHHPHLI